MLYTKSLPTQKSGNNIRIKTVTKKEFSKTFLTEQLKVKALLKLFQNLLEKFSGALVFMIMMKLKTQFLLDILFMELKLGEKA